MSIRIYRLRDLANTPARSELRAADGKVVRKARPERRGVLNVGASTLWRWIRDQKSGFPKPFKLGGNVTAFDASEIDAFISARREGFRK